MISGDLLERVATTDRLHGGLGLELGAMGAAFAHGWEPLLRVGAPPHRITMDPVQKTQTTSELQGLSPGQLLAPLQQRNRLIGKQFTAGHFQPLDRAGPVAGTECSSWRPTLSQPSLGVSGSRRPGAAVKSLPAPIPAGGPYPRSSPGSGG